MGSRLAPLFLTVRGTLLAACIGIVLVCAGCTDRDTTECEKLTGDARIAACTRMIETGGWKGADLAWAYIKRGSGKYSKNDVEGAIADFSRAIEADPKSVYAYSGRAYVKRRNADPEGAISDSSRAIELDSAFASAYSIRGGAKADIEDFDGALVDLNRAIALNPKQSDAYVGRGYAKKAKGDFPAALADYKRAIELNPKNFDAYWGRGQLYWAMREPVKAANDFAQIQQEGSSFCSTVWLFLARARGGAGGREELAANAAKLDNTKWPAPVLAFYQGRGTPESLLVAAKNPDPKIEKGQLCDAHFYLAEWYLLKNDRRRAVPLLRLSVEQCPRNTVERVNAVTELEWLKEDR